MKRLAAEIAAPTHETTDEGIRRLHERLDALDEARRELRELGPDEPRDLGP